MMFRRLAVILVLAGGMLGATKENGQGVDDHAGAAAAVTSVKGWGEVIDPDGDCDVAMEKGTLTVVVPGKAHDFAAELGRWNAPRVLSDVRGDFVAEVKVSGAFEPEEGSTIQGRKAYNGAGLLVVADPQNHVSLQRAAFRAGDHVRHYLNFEVRQGGEQVVSKYQMGLEDRETWLRLERHGRRVTAMVSQDGMTWRSYEPVEVTLPGQVQVGVEVVNSASGEFKCAFEEYGLFRRVRIKAAE